MVGSAAALGCIQVYSSRRPLRVGYYESDGYSQPTPSMRRAVQHAQHLLQGAGHQVGTWGPGAGSLASTCCGPKMPLATLWGCLTSLSSEDLGCKAAGGQVRRSQQGPSRWLGGHVATGLAMGSRCQRSLWTWVTAVSCPF